MSDLRLSALGRLEIEYGGEPLPHRISLKAQALLVFLAVTAKPHSRQALAGLLWPDVLEHSARTSLRTALSQVRRAAGNAVLADRHTVSLDPQRPYWIDVRVFEEACRRLQAEAPNDEAARRFLREGVHLFREGFLAGFPETDAALFEEWVQQEREHYRRLALDALQRLATQALDHNDPDACSEDAHRILQLDPLCEAAYRLLMQCQARSGDLAAALRQYYECVRILETELGLPPSEATVALAQELRGGTWARESSAPMTAVAGAISSHVPHNLPAALTPLLGRQAELAWLEGLLSSDGVRLVSIVGSGGMGKTRLALAAAQEQVRSGRFPHGVYYAELAVAGEPEQIVHVAAEAMHLSLVTSGGDRRLPREQLLDYLRTKRMLLVLDNVELAGDEAVLLADILRAAPGVKIVAASGERMHLPGEIVFPILGLDYENAELPTEASLPAAAQLFVQSARRVAPGFAASDEELVHILEICRLVEGMPLAIELAASWAEVLTPGEIVHELRTSLDILETDQRGVPARHRSIRAVFGGAWQRLGQPMRAIAAALSVLHGDFTRGAAQQIAGASLPQLSDLAGRSVIRFDRQHNRYAMHPMLRQYGAERLAEDTEAEAAARRRHALYFCGITQARGEELLGLRQREALAELEREADNLRVAWQWAIRQRAWGLASSAMDGLGFFYEWQRRLDDGDVACQLASAALLEEGEGGSPVLLARALTWCSVFAHARGRTREADAHLDQATGLLERAPTEAEGLLQAQALAWRQAGIQASSRSDKRVRDAFTLSLSLCQRAGQVWGTARALSGLGQADADAGDYAGAEANYREAIRLLRQLGDRRSEAHCLHRLAILLRNAGKVQDAVVTARQSYQVYQEMGDRAGLAWSGQILAECLNFAGEHEEAMERLDAAEALAADLGDSSRLANIYQEQALLLSRTARYQEGHDKGERGLALARRLDQPLRVAACQQILAALDLNLGEYRVAEARLRESEELMETSARGHEIAIVYALQAQVALALGDRTRARQRTLASLRLSSRHRDYRVFLGLQTLAMVLADAGRRKDALGVMGCLEWCGLVDTETPALWRRLFWVTGAPTPDASAEAAARYGDLDIWEVAALWAAELEKMVPA